MRPHIIVHILQSISRKARDARGHIRPLPALHRAAWPDRSYGREPHCGRCGSAARSGCGDYFRIAQHIDVDDAIAGYHGPVLLVHGTADEGVPARDSIEAARKYENAHLALIDGDDHGYHRHLDQVCVAAQKFVRGLA